MDDQGRNEREFLGTVCLIPDTPNKRGRSTTIDSYIERGQETELSLRRSPKSYQPLDRVNTDSRRNCRSVTSTGVVTEDRVEDPCVPQKKRLLVSPRVLCLDTVKLRTMRKDQSTNLPDREGERDRT